MIGYLEQLLNDHERTTGAAPSRSSYVAAPGNLMTVMAPKFVEIADLRTGLAVEFLGEPEPFDVDGQALRNRGMRLLPGHPGRIFRASPELVQVNWGGLEEEPASYGRGFNVESNEATTYYELGVISENQFERRQRALRAALDSGRDLSDWTPPWVDGT